MVILPSLLAIFISFTLSASAGMGGSLILVPAMSLILGSKQGVAIAALLLGGNNVLKVIAYRRTIPFRAAILVVLLLMAGAAIGASLMVRVPERWVDFAVILSFILSFISEFKMWDWLRRASAIWSAFFAGLSSGFSGTSGPLKGVALRSLKLDRMHLVGAASLASLAGDLTKASVYIGSSLIEPASWQVVWWALPVMPLAVLTGRLVNEKIGERSYKALFWAVIVGYTVRLFFV
jgi:uncharacterized membrane protein YfcA